MYQFVEDDMAKYQFKVWFGDDSDLRKNKILNKPIEFEEKPKKVEKPVVKVEEPKKEIKPKVEEKPVETKVKEPAPEIKKMSSSSFKERLQRNINKASEGSSKGKKSLF